MESRLAHAILAAVNDSPDSVVLMLDRSERIVYANPVARDFLGLPKEGPCEHFDWSAVLAPGQHGLIAEVFSRLRTGEAGQEFDLQLLPGGSQVPRRMRVRVRLAQAKPDDEPLWLCWGSLNAFREQLEERLRQATQRLEQTLDSGAILVFGHDRDLRITWVRNPASGRSAQSVLGLTDRDLLDDPEEAQRLMAAKRQVIETGQAVRSEQALTFGGVTRHYDYQLFPERDAQGEVCGVLGIAFDVTERRQAELALVAEQQRKDEFISLLAHELRAPLAPIRNLLALMRNASEADPVKDHLSAIDRQVRYMVRLIDDLLDLSRISRDQLNLRHAEFDLAQLLRGLIDPARHANPAQSVPRLEADIPSEAVLFFGDAERIAQVIANLLENARKFTPAHGSIQLRLEASETEVRISVRDTGIGIAQGDLKRIFERFVRVRQEEDLAQTIAPSDGLGLGLYLSHRLAAMHGGALTVASEGLGKGSVFTLTLPRVNAPHAPRKPTQRSAQRPAHPMRILVVDDHQDARDSLVLLLQAWGYEAQAGRDGLDGLRVARTFCPQVVIMDIAMPHMDGFELAKHLRAEPYGPAMRLLALTGFSNVLHQERARSAGIDAYFVKPAEPRQLQQQLSQWSTDIQRL